MILSLGTSWNILEPSNRLFLTGILSVRELHPTWQVLELSPTWIGRSVLYRRCRLAMLGSPEILPNFPNFRISESLRRKTRSSSATSKAGLAVSEDSIADSDWRLALVEHGSMDQISGHLWVTCGSPVQIPFAMLWETSWARSNRSPGRRAAVSCDLCCDLVSKIHQELCLLRWWWPYQAILPLEIARYSDVVRS